MSYSVAVECQKLTLKYASALQVTTFGCLVGTVVCLPFGGQLITQMITAPASGAVNVIYLGVLATGLAFTTWAYALARTAAGERWATTYVVPAVVVLMAWAA